MRKIFSRFCVLAAVFSMAMAMPALVDRPAWAGNGNGGNQNHPGAKKGNRNKNGQQHAVGQAQKNGGRNWNNQTGNNYRGPAPGYSVDHFDDRQRTIIQDYFRPRFQSGRCPPGLAKKYNCCLPPGHAKKWAIGYPLPRNVVFYDLPPLLLGQLGYPRPGYRYVRVAADILLIAAGTGVVLAAIEDLNSM